MFGPIAIHEKDGKVFYETWFNDECKTFPAVSVSHAKADARIKYLEALQPALEVVNEDTTKVLSESESDINCTPSLWGRNRN